MVIYLDTVICIYAVHGSPSFQARARARMAALRSGGDQAAVSDLTWLECRVKPLRLGDAVLLKDMEDFLKATGVVRLVLPSSVYERVTLIRAKYNYKLADALHLATAIEGKCDRFLTYDLRLGGFPDIPVEMLP
jgi:predicted nucleic acid-binding protein